jgi:hypothetical protein
MHRRRAVLFSTESVLIETQRLRRVAGWAIPDSGRAQRPPLSEPPATGEELTPGDRVEGLGNRRENSAQLNLVPCSSHTFRLDANDQF